jgi:hypothetical protein
VSSFSVAALAGCMQRCSSKAKIGEVRFALFIQQNVPRLNVSMKNAMFMRVVHCARYFGNQFNRSADGYGLALDYFVKLTSFDKLHAEVATTLAFADLVDGDNAWMIEAGGGLRFAAKALQMRFGGPRAKADHFESDGPIETFLMPTINYAFSAPADFLQ